MLSIFFFFNDTATTEIYTLSLHALFRSATLAAVMVALMASSQAPELRWYAPAGLRDRKNTRLNSSHSQISYAVFCLQKKKAITFYSALRTVPVTVPPLIQENHLTYTGCG